MASLLAFALKNIKYIIPLLLAGGLYWWYGYTVELRQENSNLNTKLENIQKTDTKATEQRERVIDTAIKAPKRTEQMKKIAQEKPHVLEEKLNLGFQDITNRIVDASQPRDTK